MDKVLKILIVEDNIEWFNFHKNLLSYILKDCEYSLHNEYTAQEGLETLNNAKHPYDLVISDLEMENIPEEDYAGSWFVKNTLRNKDYSPSKIIIISASYDIERVAKRFGVKFISKGVLMKNPMTLLYTLQEMLLIK